MFYDIRPSDAERFSKYFEKTDESSCWEWTGAKNRKGYGNFHFNGTCVAAYRFSYALAHSGIIPDGYMIDHKCFNPACVNPSHLRLATAKQNGEHRKGPNTNSRSGVLGVYYRKDRRQWQACIRANGRNYRKGPFKRKSEAPKAARELRNMLYTFNDLDRTDDEMRGMR